MISKEIAEAVTYLKEGELIGLPTETVYGLAANAYNPLAIKKIFDLKKRPLNNPLILHVHSPEVLKEIASNIPQRAFDLASEFWPGSLTLLLEKQSHVPDLVTAGHSTVAIRIPNHPLTLELLSQLDFPLAAPSANPFSRVSPTTAEQVEKYFGSKIPMVLDGGASKVGIESTIVGIYEDETIIHRLGGIPLEQIERVVGKVKLKTMNDHSPEAPGMMKKHYSPLTKLLLVENMVENIDSAIKKYRTENIGLLLFHEDRPEYSDYQRLILSADGSLENASKELYRSMIQMDEMNLDLILVEKFPDVGLGRSMNDKLKRAASN